MPHFEPALLAMDELNIHYLDVRTQDKCSFSRGLREVYIQLSFDSEGATSDLGWIVSSNVYISSVSWIAFCIIQLV